MGGNIGAGIPPSPGIIPGIPMGGIPGIPPGIPIPMLGMGMDGGRPGKGGRDRGPLVDGGGLIGWNDDSEEGPEVAPLDSRSP